MSWKVKLRALMFIVPWVLLLAQAGIVIASLLGFGIFTARPDLLARVDPEARFFVWAFYGFAVVNMLLGGLAVTIEALQRNNWRVILVIFAVYATSLSSELLGTTYGVPFGAYSYTELLGPKWFDRVPFLIPLSWFTMAWPAWILARQQTRGWFAVLAGTALLVAWDLVLDPAMSSVTSYWVWGERGSYYGMPWSNLWGWGVTGFVLLILLARFAPAPRGSRIFALAVYVTNLALPFGFCILREYWVAVAAGVASLLAATAFNVLGAPPKSVEVIGAAPRLWQTVLLGRKTGSE
jgi:putative membrane protein